MRNRPTNNPCFPKTKHIPLRMCIFCRNKFSKDLLLRFVNNGKNLCSDFTQHMDGRGFYCCKAEACVKKILNQRTLEKRIHQKISDKNFSDIEKDVKEHLSL